MTDFMSDEVLNNPSPPIGLFLGAGASYEMGMPLVWGLTAELKEWLTPQHLRELNEGWRLQGQGHPNAVIDDVVSLLERSDMHYEGILGYLETQFKRSPIEQQYAQDYYGLYLWLVEMVYWLLYFRHVKNEEGIRLRLRYFEGIAGLAAQNSPLWIFSRNRTRGVRSGSCSEAGDE